MRSNQLDVCKRREPRRRGSGSIQRWAARSPERNTRRDVCATPRSQPSHSLLFPHTPSLLPSSLPRCGAPAKLQCPKCVALDLPKAPAAFCSQDCFKAAWPAHKAAHRPTAEDWAFVTDRGAGRVFACPTFTWTGGLRPWKVGPRRAVPPEIARPDYALGGIPASELASRQQKSAAVRSPAEVAGIRAACRVAREILDVAAAAIRPGITTDELDAVVHEATLARGAYPSPLNYFHFPKSVCTSVNEVVCHGIPDARPLEDGDIVNVDVTAFYKGYHGDLNETFTVGTGADAASKKLIRVTAEALDKAIAAVRPGVRYRDIGDIITAHVRANECVN